MGLEERLMAIDAEAVERTRAEALVHMYN